MEVCGQYIYIRNRILYMKSSFPKSDKWDCIANVTFIDCVLERAFRMSVYVHIYEKVFF